MIMALPHLCALAHPRPQLVRSHRPRCLRRRDPPWSMRSSRDARYWFAAPVPAAADLCARRRRCPLYAFYSLVRMVVAYLLSLVFAVGYGYIAAYNKRVEAADDRRAGYPPVHPGAELSARRHARHGGALSHPPVGRGAGFDRAHLHRPGVEHGVQLLLLAQSHSARAARGRARSTVSAPPSASCSWNCRSAPSAWCGTPSFPWQAGGSS